MVVEFSSCRCAKLFQNFHKKNNIDFFSIAERKNDLTKSIQKQQNEKKIMKLFSSLNFKIFGYSKAFKDLHFDREIIAVSIVQIKNSTTLSMSLKRVTSGFITHLHSTTCC